MSPGDWLLAVENAMPVVPAPVLSRFDALGRLRLAVAWALLILVLVAMFLIVAYLFRVWRRTVHRPLSPPRLNEEDAWARKPLTRPDDEGEDSDNHAMDRPE